MTPKSIPSVGRHEKVEWNKEPTIKKGDSGLELEGKFLLDSIPSHEDYEVGVEIAYFPDRKAMPEFVLPLDGNYRVTE